MRLIYNQPLILTLTICLCLLLQGSLCFNPRVRCNHNQMLFNGAYNSFKSMISADSYLKYWSTFLAADQGCGQSYSTPITAISNSSKSLQSLQMCANFIVNLQSCCEPGSYTRWVSSLNGAYETMVLNIKYPVFKQFQRIFLQINALNCIYPDAYNPFSYFKSPDLATMVNNYINLVQQIKQNQRKFLNETSCLVCLGTQDYPTFMLPNMSSPDNPTTNSLMFQRSYFNQRVADLTQILIKLQNMHSQVLNWIKLAATNINLSYQAASCQPLRDLYTSAGFNLNEFRLCTDDNSCRQVAIKFFGLVAAPQLAYYISWRQTNTGSKTLPGFDYVVADQNGTVGFKGNTTGYANLYGTKYLSNTTTYRFSDSYSLL